MPVADAFDVHRALVVKTHTGGEIGQKAGFESAVSLGVKDFTIRNFGSAVIDTKLNLNTRQLVFVFFKIKN